MASSLSWHPAMSALAGSSKLRLRFRWAGKLQCHGGRYRMLPLALADPPCGQNGRRAFLAQTRVDPGTFGGRPVAGFVRASRMDQTSIFGQRIYPGRRTDAPPSALMGVSRGISLHTRAVLRHPCVLQRLTLRRRPAREVTLRGLPDDRLVIRINPRILLLHRVHRSDRRRRD